MSMRNWRGRQEDCRSSLTPPMVSLICSLLWKQSTLLLLLNGVPPSHTCSFQSSLSSSRPSPGRFHHPDVLQLLGSLSELRQSHVTKTENSANTEAEGASSSSPTAAPWRYFLWPDSWQAPPQGDSDCETIWMTVQRGGNSSQGSAEMLEFSFLLELMLCLTCHV